MSIRAIIVAIILLAVILANPAGAGHFAGRALQSLWIFANALFDPEYADAYPTYPQPTTRQPTYYPSQESTYPSDPPVREEGK
jgi:hypothetical protein